MSLTAGLDHDLDHDQTNLTTAIKGEALIDHRKQHLKLRKQQKVDYYSPATWLEMRRLIALTVAVYLTWMNVIVVPVACLCTLFVFIYPIKLISPSMFNKLEHELCRLVNDSWVAAAKFCGLEIEEAGDDIRPIANGRALCIANHLGLVDHFALMTAFHDKGVLAGRYLWVIFNIWRWTPVGAMWTAHGNFFVHGSGIGAAKRLEILNVFRRHLERLYRAFNYGWVVMYPEGSRLFLIQTTEQRFCQKEGLKPFRHCTHPRVGAAHAVLQVCAAPPGEEPKPSGTNDEPLDYIVDVTLGYHKGIVPSFGLVSIGDYPFPDDLRSSTIAVHYRIHRVQPEWRTNQDSFRCWLYEQYRIKDEILDYFYKTGEFPTIPKSEGTVDTEDVKQLMVSDKNNEVKIDRRRAVSVSVTRCLMVQVVWLSLYYFHWNFWLGPVIRGVWHLIY